LGLLQTVAAQFAQLGRKEEGKRFFAMNFNRFLPSLQKRGTDPNGCLDDLESLMNRLPGVQPETRQQSTANSRQANARAPATVKSR